MDTFSTNAVCPKCGKLLYTSDVEGYGFVCKECDENFYTMEVQDDKPDLHEIRIPMSVDDFEYHLIQLREITEKYNCDFLGYDECAELADIGWENGFPVSDTLNNFVKEIENKLKRTSNLDKERNMFELQTRTFFNNGSNLGHAVIFMNRNKHASKFEVIFKVNENGRWNFYYENNVCLDNNERVDFEKWFKTTV